MGTSSAAVIRWSRPGENKRMSRVMKLRYRPKSVGRITRPSEVKGFLRDFPEGIELLECSPTLAQHQHRGQCWSILVIDTTGMCSLQQYERYASRVGLKVYAYHSKVLGMAISVAVVVGKPEGV